MTCPLPKNFVSRLGAQMGEKEAEDLVAALDTEPPVSIRYNPGKTDLPKDGRRVAWCESGVYLDSRPSFTLDPLLHAGGYYVQEASSQFLWHLVRTLGAEGKRILDACASPGGKTTIYSSLAGGKGLVVANEYVRQRVQPLVDNAARWGEGNVAVTSCDTRRFRDIPSFFDIVAVDAPCSGEGMFRKDPLSRGEWSEANVRMCAQRQAEILRNVFPSLREGGVLIYSTCTFNEEENEKQMEDFSREFGDGLEEIGISVPGEWGVLTSMAGKFSTFRFLPSRLQGEGLFVAVARKRGSGRTSRLKGPSKLSDVNGRTARELERWIEGDFSFVQIGDGFYALPSGVKDTVGALSAVLPVVYSGIRMGKIYGEKLKPEQELALCSRLNRGSVPSAELDLETARNYLRKAEIPASLFAEGMNLVMYGGLGLGFVKRIGNRCNNLYPNSLRILNK